jgi:hypothetical protein
MSLISKIQSLPIDNGIIIIPKNENYFFSKSFDPIGVSFFVRTSSKNLNPYEGTSIKINWNSNNQITIDSKFITDDFTIVTLKSDSYLMQQIFLDVCMNIIKNIGPEPIFDDLKTYIENLKNLFKKKPSKKEEIGLWGELLLIYNSHNKEKAISSWHIDPKDKFDFNDGDHKIEVKTTKRNQRIHSFSNNQIIKGKQEDVVILSIMTKELYQGYNVFDLKEEIEKKVTSSFKQMLLEKIMKAAGDKLDSYNTTYDYKTAIKQSKFYKAESISCIDKTVIADEISEISFNVNFEKYIDEDKKNLPINYL